MRGASKASSERVLIIVVGGMCKERSDEQKVLLFKSGGTLFLSLLRPSLRVAFAVALLQPSLPSVLRSSSDLTSFAIRGVGKNHVIGFVQNLLYNCMVSAVPPHKSWEGKVANFEVLENFIKRHKPVVVPLDTDSSYIRA